MTHANPQPTSADWMLLAQGLVEVRDALLTLSLALSDYQLTLDSPERHAAGLQVQEFVELAKTWDFTARGS